MIGYLLLDSVIKEIHSNGPYNDLSIKYIIDIKCKIYLKSKIIITYPCQKNMGFQLGAFVFRLKQLLIDIINLQLLCYLISKIFAGLI